MNVVIAAMSAPVSMSGVSRHGVNLVRALLTTSTVSSIHFVAGEWQKEMFRNSLGTSDPRLHAHWVALPDANMSRLLWYYRELPQIAEQLRADVVQLTFPAPMGRNAYSSPVVLSLHDLYPFDIPRNFGFLKSALARHTIRQCIRRVDAITCVSAGTHAQLLRYFKTQAAKSVVVPNIVEFRVSSAPGIIGEQLKDHPFVLCVAQHRANKGVPLAVQVFAQLLENRVLPVEARLLVVGIRGPETEKIHSKIREFKLGSKVLLTSGLSDAELHWCYENCTVLLAPSSIEGFGMPIAEGMLAGSRIVCADIPAFREIGQRYCHFVAPIDDATAYTQAVRLALGLPRPARVRLAPHSPAAVGAEYARLYEILVRSPRAQFGSARRVKSLQEKEIESHPA